MPSLYKKVALVTGGGRGIGEAISTKLAEYGAVVAIADAQLQSAEAVASRLRARDLNASAFQLDVTDWTAAQRILHEIEVQLGNVDILVNNAGISSFVGFLDLEEAEWDRVLNVNLKGVFVMCRVIAPGMAKRRSGRIVNMASILGKLGEPNFAHYSASKFGVIGFTQSIAAELAEYDVTVNTVCPGIVDTPLWDGLTKEAIARSDSFTSPGAVSDFVLSRIPLKRRQPVEDIAEMVAFLVSEHGRNMTGGSYHVDGGMAPR